MYGDKLAVIDFENDPEAMGKAIEELFADVYGGIVRFGNEVFTNNVRALSKNSQDAMRNLISVMQYTDATQEETDLAAQKRMEQTERYIKSIIRSNFPWISKVENGTFDPNSDGRPYKEQPTAADAEAYNELLHALFETYDTKYVTELSELRKRIMGHVINKETRDELSLRVDFAKRTMNRPTQAARKMTDYYKSSRKFAELHAKDGDYWDSTIEMAARAFACYVADRTGKRNDYLSGHSDSIVTLTADRNGDPVVVKAFPEGKERIRIMKSLNKWIHFSQ